MKLSKKVLISSLLAFLVSSVFAQESQVKKQNNNKEEETSVESEYLNDVDGDIIITLAESDDYDNKLVALQYLQSAIEDGNESDAIIQALDKLKVLQIRLEKTEDLQIIIQKLDVKLVY